MAITGGDVRKDFVLATIANYFGTSIKVCILATLFTKLTLVVCLHFTKFFSKCANYRIHPLKILETTNVYYRFWMMPTSMFYRQVQKNWAIQKIIPLKYTLTMPLQILAKPMTKSWFCSNPSQKWSPPKINMPLFWSIQCWIHQWIHYIMHYKKSILHFCSRHVI